MDIVLGPEMKSTGEVMGIDADFGTAFAKSQAAAYGALPTKGRVFVSVANRDKRSMIFPVKRLADLGFEILATEGTAEVLRRNGIRAATVRKQFEGPGPGGEPTIVQRIMDGDVDLIINTPYGVGPASRRLRDPHRRGVHRHALHHHRAGPRGRGAGHRGAAARRHRRRLAPGVRRPAARAPGRGRRMIYRALFRTVFQGMDPERAHRLGFGAVRAAAAVPGANAAMRAVFAPDDPRLRVKALGLDFPGPFGLAAGFDKNAVGIDGLAALGFAFVEIGTVTARAQPGNPAAADVPAAAQTAA